MRARSSGAHSLAADDGRQRILLVAALLAAVALVFLIPRGFETSSGRDDRRPIELREERRARPARPDARDRAAPGGDARAA